MSDKQFTDLLDGFVKSSQSLTSLQEGILDLHGVMEQFHKATEDFAVKNEMDILLPKVNKHFTQANDVYAGIADHLKTIHTQTVEIQVTGELCFANMDQFQKQLNHIQEELQQITQEVTPVYQKLQMEMQQLKDMQSNMRDVTCEISGNVQEMKSLQQELRLQMTEYRQIMTETRQMQGSK
ncbi:MAG: hypothetical protein H7X79_11840 [Sporomusaceae bacterium]|nr:hypothetical protein [Sporomusaceae bacterium]